MVEMMVGMAIGLIVTGIIATIYINNRGAILTQEGSARVQETGRFILDVIGRSIRQAGNIHVVSTQNKSYCNCVPVTGTNGAAGASDTLTVRYEAGQDENSGGWGARDCVGGFAVAGTMLTSVFSQIDATDVFQCVGSVGGTQPLAADVEDFQVTYGVDIDADRAVDRQVADPATFLPTPKGIVLPPNPANRIVSVRVCVLVRSPGTGVVPAGGQYTNCQGASVTNPDTRLRRAFTASYTLRNTVTDIP